MFTELIAVTYFACVHIELAVTYLRVFTELIAVTYFACVHRELAVTYFACVHRELALTYFALTYFACVHRELAVTTSSARRSCWTSVESAAATEARAGKSTPRSLTRGRKGNTFGRRRTFPNVPFPVAQVINVIIIMYSQSVIALVMLWRIGLIVCICVQVNFNDMYITVFVNVN